MQLEDNDFIKIFKDKNVWYGTLHLENKELITIFSNIYKKTGFSIERELEIICGLLNSKSYQIVKGGSNDKNKDS